MITMEQVELLRTKADVSYEEARTVLEATGGDLLDAIVLLESQGKVRPPAAAKRKEPVPEPIPVASDEKEKSSDTNSRKKAAETGTAARHDTDNVFRSIGRWIKNLFQYGNRNNLQIYKDDRTMATLPLTLVVILLLLFFWAILALVAVGLFAGLHYRFVGPDIKSDSADAVMDSLSDAADTIKDGVRTAVNKEKKTADKE